MVTYSTNWMGPINLNWYKDRDLLDESGEIIGTKIATCLTRAAR